MTQTQGLPAWSLLAQHPDRTRALTIVVLYGGRSSEREVSLRSGEAILFALNQPSELRPGNVVPVEVLPSGAWRLLEESLAPEVAIARLPKEAVYLIALHGGEGEGGTVQGFLELCGRTHTGAGVAASSLCLDKLRTRQVAGAHGVRLAPGCAVEAKAWRNHPEACLAAIEDLGPGPWFVKPSHGGSSVAMVCARDREGLIAAFEPFPALGFGEVLLVEQAIAGVEVTQALMGSRNAQDDPIVLPLVEICPLGAGWFDYHQKYAADGAKEYCPPRSLSPSRQNDVARAALAAWFGLGLQSYARIDFIVPSEGDPVLLEANTLPGFTSRSLYPMASQAVGLGYRELCLELCLRAQETER